MDIWLGSLISGDLSMTGVSADEQPREQRTCESQPRLMPHLSPTPSRHLRSCCRIPVQDRLPAFAR